MENKKVLSNLDIDMVINLQCGACCGKHAYKTLDDVKELVRMSLDDLVEAKKEAEQYLKDLENVKEHLQEEFYKEYMHPDKLYKKY